MAWSLRQLIETRQADQYRLHEQYINASLARVQGIIGFDKIYTRGKGRICGTRRAPATWIC